MWAATEGGKGRKASGFNGQPHSCLSVTLRTLSESYAAHGGDAAESYAAHGGDAAAFATSAARRT